MCSPNEIHGRAAFTPTFGSLPEELCLEPGICVDEKRAVMKTGCCNSSRMLLVDQRAVCLNEHCANYLASTVMRRDFSKFKIPCAVLVLALHLFWPGDDFSKAQNEMAFTRFANKIIPVELSDQALRSELKNCDVLCADEVLAQMKLESANFKSGLLKHTNNLMGMRYPFNRKTTAAGIYLPEKDTIILTHDQKSLRRFAKQNHYAVYISWQDAVADYKLWQENNFKVTERYLTFLGSVYAEDSLYINKIRKLAAVKTVAAVH